MKKREADLPRSIESQLAEMKELENIEKSRFIRYEDLQKIENMKSHCKFDILPYDINLTKAIENRIIGRLRQFKK